MNLSDLSADEVDLLRQVVREQIRLLTRELAQQGSGSAHERVLRVHIALVQDTLHAVEAEAHARRHQGLRPADTPRLSAVYQPGSAAS